jgi:hypothetical protein
MHRRGRGDDLADQVVGQERHPQFPPNHLGCLAADVIQVQRLFDLADIQFRIPAKPVQFGEVFAGVDLGIRQENWGQPRMALPSYLSW